MERPATRTEILFLGIVASAIGSYLMLVGASLLPIPGGPQNLHAPLWAAFCIGLAFLCAGVTVLMHGLQYTDNSGELPVGAPQWLRVFQYLLGVTILGCFAAVFSWIAFGPGPRAFTGSFMGVTGPVSEMTGRIAFGIGAILFWLGTIAAAWWGAHKLRAPHP